MLLLLCPACASVDADADAASAMRTIALLLFNAQADVCVPPPLLPAYPCLQAQPGALCSKEDQALLDLAEKEGMKRCPRLVWRRRHLCCLFKKKFTYTGMEENGVDGRDAAMHRYKARCPDAAATMQLWHDGAAPERLLLHVVPLRLGILLQLRQGQGQGQQPPVRLQALCGAVVSECVCLGAGAARGAEGVLFSTVQLDPCSFLKYSRLC